jgi:hypothetical protein
MKGTIIDKRGNEIPGQWIGTGFLLPGSNMRSVNVRLSKKGHRCKFLPAKYMTRLGQWWNRERESIEVDGWTVTQWFLRDPEPQADRSVED